MKRLFISVKKMVALILNIKMIQLKKTGLKDIKLEEILIIPLHQAV